MLLLRQGSIQMADLPYDDTLVDLTRHARSRIEERNVNSEALGLLLRHGDLRRRGRAGCECVRLSRGRAKRLDRDRAYPRRTIEQARELEAVVTASARCITAWRLPADIRFRRTGARPTRPRVSRQVQD
jgi:hypothetical protein